MLVQRNLKNTWNLISYRRQSWNGKKGCLDPLWKEAYYEVIFIKLYAEVSSLLSKIHGLNISLYIPFNLKDSYSFSSPKSNKIINNL